MLEQDTTATETAFKKAMEAFDYALGHQVVDEIVGHRDYDDTIHYNGDIIITDVTPQGTIVVNAGGGEIYSAWNCESSDEGYWIELLPKHDENGKLVAYEVLGYEHL